MDLLVRYCGHRFGVLEMATIRTLIADHPTANRARLSRLVCEALQWRRSDGQLKDMSCRVAMLRMQNDGLIQLPLPQKRNHNGKPYLRRTAQAEPEPFSPVASVLVETFVQTPRFRGTCYKAANWIYLGETQGRGELDVDNKYALPDEGHLGPSSRP